MSAQFVLQLDFSIVNVALPTIQRGLHMAPSQLQWIVTGYALTFGSLLLAGGRLADRLGRRRLLVVGLVLFALVSVACGLAQWSLMLIVARLVQGGAGAMVSPAALSSSRRRTQRGRPGITPSPSGRQRLPAGQRREFVAGGILTEYLGWRAIFLVNPPIIALMLAFVRRLPRGETQGADRVDVPGAVLVTTALAALIFGLSYGQQHGFEALATIAALVAAAARWLSASSGSRSPWLTRCCPCPSSPCPPVVQRWPPWC